MTEFEKKLKIRHEKRMKYKADPEKLRMRLERDKMLMDKEYDMAATYGVDMEPWNNIPRKPRKTRVVWRILAGLIAILLVLIITIAARLKDPFASHGHADVPIGVSIDTRDSMW